METKFTIIYKIYPLFVYISFFREVLLLGGDIMTSKELLYIEDALGHENFMKSCSQKTANQLQDPTLSAYMVELEQKHTELFNSFLNLL